MGLLAFPFYSATRALGRFAFFCTLNVRVLRRDVVRRDGAFVLAVSHLGHVEPLVLGALLDRPVDWVARAEFYRSRVLGFLFDRLGCIKVRRDGVPVRTVRTALERLRGGRVVGIFPEGGVARGRASVCAGGPVRLGACLIAARAGVPLVPCVVLGTPALTKVGPWLPAKRGHVWLAFGEPIVPPAEIGRTVADRRRTYRRMGEQYRDAMAGLYRELMATYDLPGDQIGQTYAEPLTAAAAGQRGGEVVPS
ncbi:MAG TPA: lysophospholipid acyltransferase family protein [Humisphaera sp.]